MQIKKMWQILVAEDDNTKFVLIEYDISDTFGSEAQITRVKTVAELKRVYSEQGYNFSFIVLDANLKDGATLEFLDEILAREFKKPIIANSSNHEHLMTQMKFGCTHEGGLNLKNVLADIRSELIS